MVRAVGETIIVDPMFLVLGISVSGWDSDLGDIASISTLFSVLELVTELQYYVAEAMKSMEEPSHSGPRPEEHSGPTRRSRIADSASADIAGGHAVLYPV